MTGQPAAQEAGRWVPPWSGVLEPCLRTSSGIAGATRLRDLLARQFIYWGDDVRMPAGNRLVRYGFERTPCPGRPGCSRYSTRVGPTVVTLWGWGLAVHNGGPIAVCLHRRFSHPLAVFPDHIAGTWFAEDLPIPLGDGHWCGEFDSLALISNACRWISDYEAWVMADTGPELGFEQSESHLSRLRSVHDWRDLATELEHHEQETKGMSVETGKRYVRPRSAAEFIVTKSGDGTLTGGETPLVNRK